MSKVDMNYITLAVGHWLRKNSLPTDGVKIVIEFPERDHARHAEDCVKAEIEPSMMTMDRIGFGKADTMNGIGLSFRQKTF